MLALALAPSAHAVMRFPSLEEIDTLELDAREAHDFQVNRKAGSDLNDAGFCLSLAALPLGYAAWSHPKFLGFPSDGSGFFWVAYGAVPALTATMAAGNLFYAKAARYHRQREYAISYSILPFLACSATAAKIFVLVADHDRLHRGASPLLLALSFTDLFFIPALRFQYGNAEDYLSQVRVRVTGRPDRVSLLVDF